MLAVRSKRQGVSPIIATILLVAITVVMAAVLYVLVSGYFGGAPRNPVSIGWSPVTPTNQSGVNYWYNATVESSSPSNLRWSDISTVTLKNSEGGAFQGSLASLTVNSVNGGEAVYQPGTGWSYTAPASTSTAVAGGDSITVELHAPDAGGAVVFAPSSSFSGTTVLSLPT